MSSRAKPELLEIQKELKNLLDKAVEIKKEAKEKYWPLHGKKVRLKETGEIYYARTFDMFTDFNIHSTVMYDLCKSENLKRKYTRAYEDEIEEVVD